MRGRSSLAGALPGFDDSGWEAAAMRKAPEGRLVAHTADPDRVTKRIAPVKIEKHGRRARTALISASRSPAGCV